MSHEAVAVKEGILEMVTTWYLHLTLSVLEKDQEFQQPLNILLQMSVCF